MLHRPNIALSADFAASLVLPQKPDSIGLAQAALQKAATDLQAARQRHVEAHRLYAKPGEAVTITMAEIEAIGKEIDRFVESERDAAAAVDAAKAEYAAHVREALMPAIQAFESELTGKISEIAELLKHGHALHVAATRAKVSLPSRLPSLCKSMAELALEPANRILKQGGH